jgi:ubiquitin-conjugating enzyme E2 S
MATKIFHPNISKKGEICVDTLKKGWRKDYGVGHVLTVS